MNFDDLDRIVSKNPRLERHRRYYYENLILDVENSAFSLMMKSSEERYLDFLERFPKLTQRIPNKYIAHLIGIKPVQLSRVRNKLAKKKT